MQLGSFEMMTTEVTQGMWEEVMGESKYDIKEPREWHSGDGEDYPMYYVSWDDCQEFIGKMNQLDPDHIYRLPTEAEWEYACRAGSSTPYFWGDELDVDYCCCRPSPGSGSRPVGERLPNDWGLYDMSGNVFE
ncbi:SUMF1/EgtB/PvdO family nonheme iron enzyme [Candidatus Fermentibacteria bacterium]|nr:SUMF1/EgtB/PvdO family nonheme iron enzyme [Candidatus Fermentibacteria bacterium]